MKPLLPPPPRAIRRVDQARTVARGLARDFMGREIDQPQPVAESPAPASGSTARETATDAIGRRAGSLSDELDFPEFVASLLHGTFDAIVDSSIRQMESFADLVSAVAKPLDKFTEENVTANQARDWLVEQHPQDLRLDREQSSPRLVARTSGGEDGDEPRSPAWLSDYGYDGEELTGEFIEESLVPLARERVARQRLQTLATMVLLGMNRVVVKDGTIGARLRFRAAAADHTRVDYAVGDNPNEAPGTEWGQRGSRTYAAPRTKVSTVGVNVQSDSELKAELFGEVKINFASETVPLDRFVDEAQRTLLQRHTRPAATADAARRAVPQPAPAAIAPAAAAPAPSLSASSAPATRPAALPGVTP